MPLWVGLIALVNQALGYNVDYLNPRLYQEMVTLRGRPPSAGLAAEV